MRYVQNFKTSAKIANLSKQRDVICKANVQLPMSPRPCANILPPVNFFLMYASHAWKWKHKPLIPKADVRLWRGTKCGNVDWIQPIQSLKSLQQWNNVKKECYFLGLHCVIHIPQSAKNRNQSKNRSGEVGTGILGRKNHKVEFTHWSISFSTSIFTIRLHLEAKRRWTQCKRRMTAWEHLALPRMKFCGKRAPKNYANKEDQVRSGQVRPARGKVRAQMWEYLHFTHSKGWQTNPNVSSIPQCLKQRHSMIQVSHTCNMPDLWMPWGQILHRQSGNMPC